MPPPQVLKFQHRTSMLDKYDVFRKTFGRRGLQNKHNIAHQQELRAQRNTQTVYCNKAHNAASNTTIPTNQKILQTWNRNRISCLVNGKATRVVEQAQVSLHKISVRYLPTVFYFTSYRIHNHLQIKSILDTCLPYPPPLPSPPPTVPGAVHDREVVLVLAQERVLLRLVQLRDHAAQPIDTLAFQPEYGNGWLKWYGNWWLLIAFERKMGMEVRKLVK